MIVQIGRVILISTMSLYFGLIRFDEGFQEIEMNRNHFMILGTVVLLAGLVSFRVVNFTISAPVVRMAAKQVGDPRAELAELAPRTISLPLWPKYLLISGGAVFMLHAVAMPKP
jgi:hypothetical protein